MHDWVRFQCFLASFGLLSSPVAFADVMVRPAIRGQSLVCPAGFLKLDSAVTLPADDKDLVDVLSDPSFWFRNEILGYTYTSKPENGISWAGEVSPVVAFGFPFNSSALSEQDIQTAMKELIGKDIEYLRGLSKAHSFEVSTRPNEFPVVTTRWNKGNSLRWNVLEIESTPLSSSSQTLQILDAADSIARQRPQTIIRGIDSIFCGQEQVIGRHIEAIAYVDRVNHFGESTASSAFVLMQFGIPFGTIGLDGRPNLTSGPIGRLLTTGTDKDRLPKTSVKIVSGRLGECSIAEHDKMDLENPLELRLLISNKGELEDLSFTGEDLVRKHFLRGEDAVGARVKAQLLQCFRVKVKFAPLEIAGRTVRSWQLKRVRFIESG